jgi:hypothetical protein
MALCILVTHMHFVELLNKFAARMQVKRKTPDEDVAAYLEDGDLTERLGGPAAACATGLRGLLVAGGRSFTHTLVALERYLRVLQSLLAKAGAEVCRGWKWQWCNAVVR